MTKSISLPVSYLFFVLVISGCNLSSDSGCGKDTDCKGDRICENGECVNGPIGKSLTKQLDGAGEAKMQVVPKKSSVQKKKLEAPSKVSQTPKNKDVWLDKQSGLMWQVKPSKSKFNWTENAKVCEQLTLAGFKDWRLPSVSDLRSIIEDCPNTELGGSCDLEKGGCKGCLTQFAHCYWPKVLKGKCSSYWTNTSECSEETGDCYVWYINFRNATINIDGEGWPSGRFYSRCVRGKSKKTEK